MTEMLRKCLLLVSCFISIQTSTADNYSVSTSDEPCQLAFEDVKNGTKKMNRIDNVLYITIRLTNSSHIPDSLGQNSDLFHAREWIRVSGTHGKGILQLRPNYKIMSLNLLSYNTHHVELRLQTISQGCMEQFNVSEYELFLRHFLLNHTKEEDEICNVHVGNNSGYAEFYHECCRYDQQKEMKCYRVEKNKWMAAIDYCTYLVIVLVFLYCPYIIPSSFYNPELADKTYEYSPDEQFTFTVKKTTAKRWNQNDGKNKIPQSEYVESSDRTITPVSFQMFRKMKIFKKTLRSLDNDKVYNIKVSKIQFRVGSDELVSANDVPTGFFKACYDAIIQCGLRGQKEMKTCCYANIFGSFQPDYPWYKCWRRFMGILLSLAVCTPWIIRVSLFYGYENSIREARQVAAESRNLKVELENNLAYYVTPFHVFFIVCYVLVLGVYFLLGVLSMVLFRNIKTLVQEMVQSCLVDMFDDSRRKVLRWSLVVMSKPLTKCGIFGLLFGIFYWVLIVPVVALVFAYYLFPTVYLSVSFISLFVNISTHFDFKCEALRKRFWKMNKCIGDPFSFEMLKPQETSEDDETKLNSNHKKNVNDYCNLKLLKIALTIALLIMVISFFILSIECIIFLIEVTVYTMIGLILNSSHAMQYISTLSLAWLYYNKCFGGISKIFLRYNKAVHAILYKENKKQVDRVAREHCKNQKNTAFKAIYGSVLKSRDEHDVEQFQSDKKTEIRTDFGMPKLKTNKIILLLDQYDKQYITKKFFFEICKIRTDGPGPLADHILKAVRRFLTIGIFLVFVTIVVLAFGESYSISFPNQLLATLAGGVVPLILIKANVLFPEPEELDEKEIIKKYFYDEDKSSYSGDTSLEGAHVTRLDYFKKSFHKIIENDEKWWNIQDMEVKQEVNALECIEEINETEIDLIVLENCKTGQKKIEKSEEHLLNENKIEIPENNEKDNLASGLHVNDVCVNMKGL
ncbi:unnamed protein product [Mytilus coruscus]|uniref:Uncharacterized protein n=1 Tax=Mytilus coruscus TaxID=42192 RepID=A0A6J8CT54_MYTCO|nr:unnamed protein product [Mytilus coruscus]